MNKNIIIAGLLIISMLSVYRLLVERQERAQIALIPTVKVIDWPEELAPLILDDSTFTGTLWFKMKGPDKLEVGFSHAITLVRSESTYPDAVYQGDPVDYIEYVQDSKIKILYHQTKKQIDSLKSIQ